ncbi:MAG: transcription termination factor NusA [Oscillospiraceae bacterium]|nr:transcription termination factor NusA [Oscillospiraceae bacterium]
MNAEFFAALEALQEEKGIEKSYMLEKIETALITAFKRDNNNANVRVYLNEEKKDIRVFQLKNIVENVEDPVLQIDLESAKKINPRCVLGGVAEIEFKPKDFGRISATTAKQVIIQGIREAERDMLAKEFENKREELLPAIVYKIFPDTGDALLTIEKNEMILLSSEMIPGETLKEGSDIKVYVTEVKNQARGPIVTISRKHSGLVKRLFELEVPEIADGTVIINALAREAGSRTKVAVSASNPDVDPVGSCIGPKRIRVNTILKELNGEKIDIIKYSDEPEEYIKAALSPATAILEVFVNPEERTCRVLVDAQQLSLAIGKEGQNARLAARLTGYKIDIKAQPEERDI